MSRLMLQLLARGRFMNAAGEEGSDTSGTGTGAELVATPEVLEEHGMSQAEFDALSERDKQNLLAADTHDDGAINALTPAPAPGESAPGAHSSAPAATPAAPAPPAKAPAAAAPAPKADEGADPVEEDPAAAAAAAQAAAAAAPAAQAPAAAPAPSAWKAVENPVDDMADAIIVLPKVPEPPKFVPIAAPDAATKRDTAQAAIDALEQKYEDGEITLEELRTQRAPHRREVDELNATLMADRVNQHNSTAAAAQRFQTYVTASLEQAKAAGLDYLAEANKGLLEKLDAALKRFGQAAALMHPGKSTDWHDRWALNEAHKEVAASQGINLGKPATAPAQAPAAAPAAAKPAANGQRPAPDLSQLPPTLRNVPTAADPHVKAGEFAHLDALNPLELEQAVARMTPDQRDRYLGE